MSQLCATPKCERNWRALCDCCQQNLCLQHLNEHNALLVSQLNPFTDQVNALGDRLNTISLHGTARDCREKLEEWHLDCHQKIDYFFKKKCQELDRLVAVKTGGERKKIQHIKNKLVKLTRDQEATQQDIDILTSTIGGLQNEMNKMEQAHFRIDTRPLIIDDTSVQINEIYEHDFDPSALSSVYKTVIPPKGSWQALASNDRYLLMHQQPHLCFLDTELTIVRQFLWPYKGIDDMCWSSTLDRFIVISQDNIFLMNESTMYIECVQTIKSQSWAFCTCFNDQLFLSTSTWGSSIVKISLLPSIAVINEWKSPTTCTTNEFIDDIVYHNETLGLVIRNKIEKSVRMELRSCQSLDRLWSCLLDVVYNKDIPFHCCSLDCNEWLVTDISAGRLLHITTDGKMKQTIIYKSIPYRITLFGPKMLVIVTKKGINFHKI